MNYLYNGVEAPDINTVWTDKETYSYAMIFVNTETNWTTGITETYTYLWFLDNPPYVFRGEGTSGNIAGGAIIQSYRLTGGNWEYYATHEWPHAFTYPFDSIIYANYDLLDSDGTLYLAASDPVPVEETTPAFSLKAWLTGYALGIAGKPLPFAGKKEPVAYLYNGVRLPKLPEWDKEAYPYAVIAQTLSGDGAVVFGFAVCADPWYVGSYSSGDNFVGADGNGFQWTLIDGVWVQNNMFWGTYNISDDGYGVWSNHDVIDTTDGTIYLTASEPVPIYE